MCRLKDTHHTDKNLEYPTEVRYWHTHNHHLHNAASLRWKDVSDSTRQRIVDLLYDGYRPAAALNKFKLELQQEDPENFVFVSADWSKCPDKDYVRRQVNDYLMNCENINLYASKFFLCENL